MRTIINSVCRVQSFITSRASLVTFHSRRTVDAGSGSFQFSTGRRAASGPPDSPKGTAPPNSE
eukprot:1479956-Rhodomonas_salina.1